MSAEEGGCRGVFDRLYDAGALHDEAVRSAAKLADGPRYPAVREGGPGAYGVPGSGSDHRFSVS